MTSILPQVFIFIYIYILITEVLLMFYSSSDNTYFKLFYNMSWNIIMNMHHYKVKKSCYTELIIDNTIITNLICLPQLKSSMALSMEFT